MSPEKQRILVEQHLSTAHCVVCYIFIDEEGIYMVSAYFQYSDDIDVHQQHLGDVIDSLRGKRVIVGVDLNTPCRSVAAHSNTLASLSILANVTTLTSILKLSARDSMRDVGLTSRIVVSE
ncbi:hypothetical protein ACJJTC_000809 [Scirpophaga incertulas]